MLAVLVRSALAPEFRRTPGGGGRGGGGVQVLGSGGFQAVSHLAGQAWYGTSQASSRPRPDIVPQEVQNELWENFFSAPKRWWDNRRSKPSPRHPDFKHKKSENALWLDNRHKPAWVDSRLAMWDAAVKSVPDLEAALVQRPNTAQERPLDVEPYRQLCERGRLTDAVAGLELLVQRGCRVHSKLFYRVLKRCIASNDLGLGRRVHALAIANESGDDRFLATHLTALYSSHGKLNEALQAFAKVARPDAHAWATIILACAKQGQHAQVIRLYRQMRESTTVITPDTRIYSAVLRACAGANDLITGKEVHAHILAGPAQPDTFLHRGLIDMYAKCNSLVDARIVFDSLPDRNVATWNAMLAGYVQHGLGLEALGLYNHMQQEGLCAPNSATFVCILQACACVGKGALQQGKLVHTQIRQLGLQYDVVIGRNLFNMYAKCGSAHDARRKSDRYPEPNSITGRSQQGVGHEDPSLVQADDV